MWKHLDLLASSEQIHENGLGEQGMLAQENQAAGSFTHVTCMCVKPGVTLCIRMSAPSHVYAVGHAFAAVSISWCCDKGSWIEVASASSQADC